MDFFTIGSGSSGNCSFVGTDSTRILIDAGISGKRTVAALTEKSIDPADIDGILITHEHRDHISCLGVLLRKYSIPVYATRATIKEITRAKLIGEIDENLLNPIVAEEVFSIGDLNIKPLNIKHDAADPVAYRVSSGESSIGIVTDLGCYDNHLIDELQGLDGLMLEANHDVRMLETGVYPYQLKRRIASDYGHLSNEACGRLLSKLLHDDYKWTVLGHLSAENNYDKLAKESVSLEISLSENKYRANDFPLLIADRKDAGQMLKV